MKHIKWGTYVKTLQAHAALHAHFLGRELCTYNSNGWCHDWVSERNRYLHSLIELLHYIRKIAANWNLNWSGSTYFDTHFKKACDHIHTANMELELLEFPLKWKYWGRKLEGTILIKGGQTGEFLQALTGCHLRPILADFIYRLHSGFRQNSLVAFKG